MNQARLAVGPFLVCLPGGPLHAAGDEEAKMGAPESVGPVIQPARFNLRPLWSVVVSQAVIDGNRAGNQRSWAGTRPASRRSGTFSS